MSINCILSNDVILDKLATIIDEKIGGGVTQVDASGTYIQVSPNVGDVKVGLNVGLPATTGSTLSSTSAGVLSWLPPLSASNSSGSGGINFIFTGTNITAYNGALTLQMWKIGSLVLARVQMSSGTFTPTATATTFNLQSTTTLPVGYIPVSTDSTLSSVAINTGASDSVGTLLVTFRTSGFITITATFFQAGQVLGGDVVDITCDGLACWTIA